MDLFIVSPQTPFGPIMFDISENHRLPHTDAQEIHMNEARPQSPCLRQEL